MHVGRFRHSHIALGRKKWPRSNIPHIVTLNTYAFLNKHFRMFTFTKINWTQQKR